VAWAVDRLEGESELVSGYNTEYSGSVDALHAPGIGDHDAFDVFDDIAAAAKINVLRKEAEDLSRFGRRICNGNRLGASQRRDKFAAQNIDIDLFPQCVQIDHLYLL
jgi:hypothetical protein